MSGSAEVNRARGRYRILYRWRGPDHPATTAAKAEMRTIVLEERIREYRALSPPTTEHLRRLARALQGDPG